MEEINELIRHYNLEQTNEYVIIPYTDSSGGRKRCFLLKRRFIRIAFPEGHLVDFPLSEAIEATVRYPELRLSESIYLVHKEFSEGAAPVPADSNDTDIAPAASAQ
jgi:hypothetical protein